MAHISRTKIYPTPSSNVHQKLSKLCYRLYTVLTNSFGVSFLETGHNSKRGHRGPDNAYHGLGPAKGDQVDGTLQGGRENITHGQTAGQRRQLVPLESVRSSRSTSKDNGIDKKHHSKLII